MAPPLLGALKRRVKPLVRDQSRRLADRLDNRAYLLLDYPPAAVNEPRWGWGRPEHPGLLEVIGRHEDVYRGMLERVLPHADALAEIPLRQARPGEPYWLSAWMPGLDAAMLYSLVSDLRPKRYLEVGSGVSTMFAARARSDAGCSTTITSIDPSPRAEIDALCDRVVRSPLEHTSLEEFDELEPGDIVFIDNSHRVFMNSDVVTFFFDVLPRIPDGVIVGIHDVVLPSDYMPEWRDYFFSEQYLLAAYLLNDAPVIDPLLATFYAATRHHLSSTLDPLFSRPALAGVERRGWAYWFTARQRAGAGAQGPPGAEGS